MPIIRRRTLRIAFGATGTVLAAALLVGPPTTARADVFCAPERPATCEIPAQEAVHNAVDTVTSTAGDQQAQAESNIDQTEQPYEPTINSVDPTSKIPNSAAWTGYVAATLANQPVPAPATTPMSTATRTVMSAETATALRSISFRDDYYNDSGSCTGYADKPEGAYDRENGTLGVTADGWVQCNFEDGYAPDITITLQLYGSGPYNFTNGGQSSSCSTTNNCDVSDFRYFNLDCGQGGTYDHGAHLTGQWLDEAGYWHSIDAYAEHNRGRYWHDC